MSSDDGFNPEMTSDEDFRGKFSALLDERNIKLERLCVDIGISFEIALEAIHRGAYGLPGTSNILQMLLQPFGLGLEWLFAGQAPAKPAMRYQEASLTEQRRQLRTLAWDFALRNNIPEKHRRRLAMHVVSILDNRPAHTLLKAARPGVPRNMTDMAYHYQRLLKEGFFDRA
jgi:hypothetical protein